MENNWLPGGEPFMFKRGPVGCLLIHGFTGAPYEMRELGEYLASRGITVSGPALAGHATSHMDMENTRWHDWYATVRAALDELKGVCGQVFVAGLSLGGLQTLHLATHDREIKGIVAMAAPVQIRNWMIPVLLPLFRGTPLKRLHRFHKSPPPDMKDRDAQKAHVCYRYTPMSCVVSLIEYMAHVKQDLGEINVPALLIQGTEDHTVQPDNLDIIYDGIASKNKQKIRLENSWHVVTKDFEKQTVFEKTYEFISKLS